MTSENEILGVVHLHRIASGHEVSIRFSGNPFSQLDSGLSFFIATSSFVECILGTSSTKALSPVGALS